AIVAASVAGGALALLIAGWRQHAAGGADRGQWVVAATMGILILGSWVRPVVVYRGAESEAFNLDEGFFVILALLVPPLLTLGSSWTEFGRDLPLQLTLAGTGALIGVVAALAIQAQLWALALAVPGLVLERQLISARFAALHDRARMQGLYEVTLAANQRLQ